MRGLVCSRPHPGTLASARKLLEESNISAGRLATTFAAGVAKTERDFHHV